MNTKTRNLILRSSLTAMTLALLVSACGKIPSPYRGDFADSATGTKLTLSGSSGTLVTQDGRIINTDAASLDFTDLEKANPGIYVRPDELDANVVEVFWLVPKKETRKQEADFVWMDAEVIYSRMNSKEEKDVQQFKMVHCENGSLMLDLQSKTWNGGCPAQRTDYDFVRVSK